MIRGVAVAEFSSVGGSLGVGVVGAATAVLDELLLFAVAATAQRKREEEDMGRGRREEKRGEEGGGRREEGATGEGRGRRLVGCWLLPSPAASVFLELLLACASTGAAACAGFSLFAG